MKNKILNINDFIRYKNGANKGRIDWKSNIGLNVEILYGDKIYTVDIIDIIAGKSKVVFTYLGERQKPMFTGHFIDCKFGKVFSDKIFLKDKIKETNYEIDYDRCHKELNFNNQYINNITFGSDIKIYVKCSKCGIAKRSSVIFLNIYNRNSKCEYCSSGLSYPERYFSSIMRQLDEKYIKTKFNWSNNREYDCYFSQYDLCIELHGLQHYKKGFDTMGGHTVEYEKANDKYKKHMAKQNGIKNYIQIDCRNSNPNYIKNNITKSLSWLFDFSNIEWDAISRQCENSIVLDVCKMWNSLDEYNRTTTSVADMFNISVDSVRIYLKKGNEQNWTKYDVSVEITKSALKSNKQKRKKVRCITTGKEYNSLMEIEKELNIPCSNVSKCCNNKYGFKTAGGYVWEFC